MQAHGNESKPVWRFVSIKSERGRLHPIATEHKTTQMKKGHWVLPVKDRSPTRQVCNPVMKIAWRTNLGMAGDTEEISGSPSFTIQHNINPKIKDKCT